MLLDAGYRAYFVGGCVRNELLGAPVGDIDIATDAHPQQVRRLSAAAGLKSVPTGMDHGTVTVLSGGIPHEVTTFRKDVRTDGRHAQVVFSDEISDDARRRDFTMNALYAQRDGQVLDPVGGLDDLYRRRLRFIEDPRQRITEDYLRILRFFRFHAWYGDPASGLDAEGLAACAALADGLCRLSRERVGAEMFKLLGAPDPAPAVAAMAQAGVLRRVLPGADATPLPVLVHLEGLAHADPAPLRRLALIAGSDQPPDLRLSRAQARDYRLRRDHLGGTQPPAELSYRLGPDVALDVVLMRCALFEQHPGADLAAQIARGAAAEFPVRAADLQPDFQGPALGKKLAALEARWIASDFSLSRNALLD
ncbi:CCA tRNA nucleotidyltransferase [Brevirhabdus sp.]|uniref:CCA tRNA nucleotidyltransferase n=1 Tax=Brevirhabdus sp. TaxID=2004514 RepID=UPI0040592BA6